FTKPENVAMLQNAFRQSRSAKPTTEWPGWGCLEKDRVTILPPGFCRPVAGIWSFGRNRTRRRCGRSPGFPLEKCCFFAGFNGIRLVLVPRRPGEAGFAVLFRTLCARYGPAGVAAGGRDTGSRTAGVRHPDVSCPKPRTGGQQGRLAPGRLGRT